MSVFGGVHVGLSSLYAVALEKDGTVLARAGGRFKEPAEMAQVLEDATAEVCRQLPNEAKPIWTLALEKPQRLTLAPRRAELAQVGFQPQVVQPALSATLLGAIPTTPGLLISLGREVRFALIDSTLTFREYRIVEGGGAWWQQELPRLAVHSTRLGVHLKNFPKGVPPLSRVSSLLEMGVPPTPDPVLKPRVEKIARKLSEMSATLIHRMPGISRFHISGFLADSSLGRQLGQALQEHARAARSEFPPEVGAALSSLALERENWERSHLEKEDFAQDRSVDEWAPPKVLVRRLFRMRKPFERYGEIEP